MTNLKLALLASIALHACGLVAFGRSSFVSPIQRSGQVVEIGLVGRRKAPASTSVGRARASVKSAAAVTKVPSSEASGGEETGARERYIDELRGLLEARKTYPKVSRYLNESGAVLVRFVVLRDGRIAEVEIIRPSAYERLNHAARQLVTSLETHKPPPAEAAALHVELPIEYVLK